MKSFPVKYRTDDNSSFNGLPVKGLKKVKARLREDGDSIPISETIGDPEGLWWLRYSGKKIILEDESITPAQI